MLTTMAMVFDALTFDVLMLSSICFIMLSALFFLGAIMGMFKDYEHSRWVEKCMWLTFGCLMLGLLILMVAMGYYMITQMGETSHL